MKYDNYNQNSLLKKYQADIEEESFSAEEYIEEELRHTQYEQEEDDEYYEEELSHIGWRIFANTIDNVIVGVVSFIIGYVVNSLLVLLFASNIMSDFKNTNNYNSVDTMTSAQNQLILIVVFTSITVFVLIKWLYYAFFESSKLQATPGKLIFGMRVASIYDGYGLTFGQASVRYAGRYLSFLLLGIGYMIQPFNQDKQTLHDKIAGSIVYKIVK